MTKDNGDHLFVPLAANWLASGSDDDDDTPNIYIAPLTHHNDGIITLPHLSDLYLDVASWNCFL